MFLMETFYWPTMSIFIRGTSPSTLKYQHQLNIITFLQNLDTFYNVNVNNVTYHDHTSEFKPPLWNLSCLCLVCSLFYVRSLGQSFFLETSRNNVLFFIFKANKLLGKLLWIPRLQIFLDEKWSQHIKAKFQVSDQHPGLSRLILWTIMWRLVHWFGETDRRNIWRNLTNIRECNLYN